MHIIDYATRWNDFKPSLGQYVQKCTQKYSPPNPFFQFRELFLVYSLSWDLKVLFTLGHSKKIIKQYISENLNENFSNLVFPKSSSQYSIF